MDQHNPKLDEGIDGTSSTDARNQSILESFRCAFEGISHAVKTQRNMRVHIVVAALALILGCVCRISAYEWLAIVICIFVTLAMELINTSIESIMDRLSPQWNILTKHAKDCAAGAVLVCAMGSVIVACIVYIPSFLDLISQMG